MKDRNNFSHNKTKISTNVKNYTLYTQFVVTPTYFNLSWSSSGSSWTSLKDI